MRVNPISKAVAIIAIVQAAAVLFAYCAALIGEKYWEKTNERDWNPRPPPDSTYFLAHFGLWLLLLPLAWSLVLLVKDNSGKSRFPVGLWWLLGIAMTAVISIMGLWTFINAFNRFLFRY
jgi:hypothetical protein